MTASLSLYVIEDGLAELLLAREETLADLARLNPATHPGDVAEATDALAVIERTLAEYMSLEVRKVDNYHRFLTVAKNLVGEMKEEESRIAGRRRRLESAVAWLKERALSAMSIAEKKRVDGTAGRYLLRKGNGGLAPLVIDGWDGDHWTTDKSVLPDDYIVVSMRMPRNTYREVLAACVAQGATLETMLTIQITGSQPDGAAIRAALGQGDIVPGARLAERGEHLEAR